ncbi:PREDICTED: uncharacterized protein LOC103339651 [Prunus mume]|uniref:Uncharacterized protein LOC103339651 n=1 Tax=Prunus mume TaxID=102107 RepID=A0ABM0PL58_PRUMU|nr:PREDICTED: uncharacterized protein LOC103339651 [Prunus mume]
MIVKTVKTLNFMIVLMTKVKMNNACWRMMNVDHNAPDMDPAADEREKSDDMAISDVNNLDSSSCDEVELPLRKRKRKLPTFEDIRPKTYLNKPIFKLGLRFPSVYVFSKAVRNYSVFNIRKIKLFKNDKDKVRAVCNGIKNGKCPLFIYASAVNGSSMVQIKSYEDEHTCGTIERNVHANSSWLAERYATQLSIIINWDFETLWDYVEELKKTNVGTTVKIKSNLEGDKSRFERIYICLAATKKGFIDGLRPVVGLDDCHIKRQHPGQLLSAVGVDPNNGMYPIAYVVAKAENYATWTWFLELLAVDLGIENSNGYVFITDRQKSLIDTVGDMFPNSEHRHCPKHLHANFIPAGHRGLVLKQHMEAAARNTTIPWFQAEMKKLQDLLGPTFEWLSRLDPIQWCRSHFRTHSKCDIPLNNMCGAFNKSIFDARDKPIITLLQRIRYYIMLLIATRKEAMEKWAHDVGPRVFATLEKLKKQSTWCIPRLAGESKYEVKCFGGTQGVVDLRNISCSCRQ